MIEAILKIIGLTIVALGVIAVYDARTLSKKFFSNSDKNNSTKLLKIVGFILSLIGIGILYIVF